MLNTTKAQGRAACVSAFVAVSKGRGYRSDIWSEVGRAIEAAYRKPAPISQSVRIAIVLAVVVAMKLCSVWML